MSLLDVQDLAEINGLASTLGLNQWQIQESSWNGYKFATVTSNILSKNSSGLGPISSVISATTNIIDSTEQILGIDANSGAVPSGANMQLQNSTDVYERRVSINSLPNGKDNIRDLGYHGQSIVLYGIDWGTNYLNGMKNNLINMFYSDQLESARFSPDFHVLVHPFLGRIPNVWLLSMRIIHQAQMWRACVYELRFKSEYPISGLNTTNDFFQTINNTVSGILSITSSLTSLWADFNFVTQGNPQNKFYRNNAIITQQVVNIQSGILNACNNSIYTTKLLTEALAPTGYINNLLNKTPAIPTISQLDYFINHFTPQDINNMIDILTANINIGISNIYQYGANNYYDSLSLLQNLITNVSKYAQTLLYNYYGQLQVYVIPRPMNLFEACQINNIDYEANYAKIIAVNQGKLFWLNNLPKDLSLLLPTSN